MGPACSRWLIIQLLARAEVYLTTTSRFFSALHIRRSQLLLIQGRLRLSGHLFLSQRQPRIHCQQTPTLTVIICVCSLVSCRSLHSRVSRTCVLSCLYLRPGGATKHRTVRTWATPPKQQTSALTFLCSSLTLVCPALKNRPFSSTNPRDQPMIDKLLKSPTTHPTEHEHALSPARRCNIWAII